MAPSKRFARSRRGFRRAPKTAGTLWIWGGHAALAALANPARVIDRIVATEEMARRLPKALPGRPAVELVSPGALSAVLPPQSVHQGLALLAKPLESPDLREICVPQSDRRSLVVALDQVTDPRNVGAILRSAAAFGVQAVVTPAPHSPPETGALAKAASGALERVPVVRVVNLARALDQLADLGYWRIGLDSDAEQTLSGAGEGKAVALVLGGEGSGMRRLTAEHCDARARLATRPVTGASGSLNVSVAASVALYELTRA